MTGAAGELRRLSIVGIGEDGIDGLSPTARQTIAEAELLVGGARHLALIGKTACERLAWPSPLQEAFPAILAGARRPVVILDRRSLFSWRRIADCRENRPDPEINVFPAPSAYTLAAARLGWAGQDLIRISLHGRALERILPHLHPGAKILALSWDQTTPQNSPRF